MNKASFEKVIPPEGSSFKAFYFKAPFMPYGGRWHFHPEFEIVYLPSGKGRRFIGTKISQFTDGDLVLLGPNIPHNCFNVGFESDNYEEYVIQFNGEDIKEASKFFKEFNGIGELLTKAQAGLSVNNKEKHIIGEEIKQMINLPPLEKLLKLFKVLRQFAEVSYESLHARQYLSLSVVNTGRVKEIYDIIQNNYQTNISTRQVAEKTGMTESSFCRFFVKSTGKTFKQAVTEVRIQNACNLLVNSDASIGTIAFDCGFNSLSLFNRLFKRNIDDTPNSYRQKYINHVQVSFPKIA
ncbi:AraC family transcriptional regulator [Aquimarina algiphila]|uniref:AraC family transcriptional regulator n=1 Tax=Aquimarina algiphila TaxID=2047982 RepID=A0A554VI03_9FLAO|nr:AraC family transcriptional regulator [Aquimarina algiphila]TSE07245.1 AraC family transcriptional regulator [Aquimarina algiphila]